MHVYVQYVHHQHNTQHSCQVILIFPKTTTTKQKEETTTEEKTSYNPKQQQASESGELPECPSWLGGRQPTSLTILNVVKSLDTCMSSPRRLRTSPSQTHTHRYHGNARVYRNKHICRHRGRKKRKKRTVLISNALSLRKQSKQNLYPFTTNTTYNKNILNLKLAIIKE